MMDIRSVMKRNVISIKSDALLGEAIRAFVDNRVGLLPVVDQTGKLVGVLGLRQVLELSMPAFVGMIEDYDFVHDFGALETSEIPEELLNRPVAELMEAPIHVVGDCRLMRAAAIMRQHRIRDLPVVDEQDQLVGLASWVDVGTSFLRDRLGGS
ncbi:MAG TPA: CBS domain-containing protein [Anaerolineales bacterium]|jgi:CBS domain-containing protein